MRKKLKNKLKILLLRLVSIIFIPILSLIPNDKKNLIVESFPNEFSKILGIIICVIFITSWFIAISKIIYRMKQEK